MSNADDQYHIGITKAEREVALALILDIEGAHVAMGQCRFADYPAARAALKTLTDAPDHARKNAHRSLIRKLGKALDLLG